MHDTDSHFFPFSDPATAEIYTLSLHDALPISSASPKAAIAASGLLSSCATPELNNPLAAIDRKSTRLNSSHVAISYAVFCLKKKQKTNHRPKPLQYHESTPAHHPHIHLDVPTT